MPFLRSTADTPTIDNVTGASDNPWLELLAPLREVLTGRDAWGKRGSLRWLERAVTARGGRGGSVRNILYKNLGSFEEKRRLYDLFAALYDEVGLGAPAQPVELRSAGAKRALGRDKRLLFARFVRDYGAQLCPQLVVVGGAATGKSVLLESVHQAVPDALYLNLSHDLSPTLFLLAETLGVTDVYERLSAQLSPKQAYAQGSALQSELQAVLRARLNARGLPLLLRAEERATLGGVALRSSGGEECTLALWLEPLLAGLEVPYLAALSGAPRALPFKLLRPPSRREARRFLGERLPGSAGDQLEAILNRAGCNYGELSRLALFERVRAGDGNEDKLQRDPALQGMLGALAALSPEADPAVPLPLLEAVLGRPLSRLSQAEQALIEPQKGQLELVKPALRTLLPEAVPAALHERALDYYLRAPDSRSRRFRVLHHAKEARAFERLLPLLEEDPSRLALLPGLWREAGAWPEAVRVRLAYVVVRYRAVLGAYTHPEAQDALEVLAASTDQQASAWARVKVAEAHIDAGRMTEAQAILDALPELSGEAAAEALLVRAALVRWRGDYTEAEAHVRAVLELPIPPLLENRARLWQGLVAKDAGRFDEALAHLGRVSHNTLLEARARYQEGDLRGRLGDPERGAACIEEALELLQTSVSDEERARVHARLGTVLRRSGRFSEARRHFAAALGAASDPFTEARVRSEAAVVESAQGRPWEAIGLAGAAEAFYREADARPEEATYRLHRTRYRLAIAYRVWRSGEPYCPPYRGPHHAPEAQAMLRSLLTEVAPRAESADRYALLHLDTVTALALTLGADEALALLEPLPPRVPRYLHPQLRLATAEAQLRAGRSAAAAASLAALRTLPPDPALRAWRAALEAELLLALGQGELACDVISEALTLPRAFRAQLGRVWGQLLVAYEQEALAERWVRLGPSRALALPEALALYFHSEAPRSQRPSRAA